MSQHPPESPETTPLKVHRVVLLVVDHDRLGAESVREEIENARYANDCIYPRVMSMQTVIVDWHDAHPLNIDGKEGAEFRRLFGGVNAL